MQKDATTGCEHWSYVFLTSTHRYYQMEFYYGYSLQFAINMELHSKYIFRRHPPPPPPPLKKNVL